MRLDSDFGEEPGFGGEGRHRDSIGDELQRVRIENEEAYALLDDVHKLFVSMTQSDDLPNHDAHESELEELQYQIQEYLSS